MCVKGAVQCWNQSIGFSCFLFSILRRYSFLICHASYFILYFKSEISIKSVIFPPKTRHVSSYLPIIVECCWTAASKSLSSMVHSPIAAHPQTLIQIQGKTWIFPPIVRRYGESAWMSCASCGSADAGRCHTSPRLPVWSGVMWALLSSISTSDWWCGWRAAGFNMASVPWRALLRHTGLYLELRISCVWCS